MPDEEQDPFLLKPIQSLNKAIVDSGLEFFETLKEQMEPEPAPPPEPPKMATEVEKQPPQTYQAGQPKAPGYYAYDKQKTRVRTLGGLGDTIPFRTKSEVEHTEEQVPSPPSWQALSQQPPIYDLPRGPPPKKKIKTTII